MTKEQETYINAMKYYDVAVERLNKGKEDSALINFKKSKKLFEQLLESAKYSQTAKRNLSYIDRSIRKLSENKNLEEMTI